MAMVTSNNAAPLGWECRARLVKQVPLKPTVRRPTKYDDFVFPGPAHYDTPEITGGNGFSQIKRAPAFTFGHRTPIIESKPAASPKAPVYNIRHMCRKGKEKIPQGIIAEKCALPADKTRIPGPNEYLPNSHAYLKRMPAYSMRIAAKEDYTPWDQWTPPPNMYCPPIPAKNPPKYTFGDKYKQPRDDGIPGPGAHNPRFEVVKKTKPAFTLKGPIGLQTRIQIPAPNEYCHKRLLYSKPCAPAISFGIKHSPYVGATAVYEMPSKLEMLAKDIY